MSNVDLTEKFEEEIFRIIIRDDVSAFGLLLDGGLSVGQRFRGEWITEYAAFHESNSINIFDFSIAQVVVMQNAKKLAELILEDENISSYFTSGALIHFACDFGIPDMVTLMIKKGFSANKKRDREPPVFAALKRKYYDCVKVLIDSRECNLYVRDKYVAGNMESWPLSEVARCGRLDLVEQIVKYKINKPQMSRASIVAAQNKHEEVAMHLLDMLDNVQKKNCEKDYPYHIIIPAVEHGLMKIVDRMIKKDIRTVRLIIDGQTMLSLACGVGNLDLVKRLISLGAILNSEDKSRFYLYTGEKVVENESEDCFESWFNPYKKMNEMRLSRSGLTEKQMDPLIEARASCNVDLIKYLEDLTKAAQEGNN